MTPRVVSRYLKTLNGTFECRFGFLGDSNINPVPLARALLRSAGSAVPCMPGTRTIAYTGGKIHILR